MMRAPIIAAALLSLAFLAQLWDWLTAGAVRRRDARILQLTRELVSARAELRAANDRLADLQAPRPLRILRERDPRGAA